MSFGAGILILLLLLPFFTSLQFSHPLPVTHILHKAKPNRSKAVAASYLAPATGEGHMVTNTSDVKSRIETDWNEEQPKHFEGNKGTKDDVDEKNQEEMKYESIKGWEKLNAPLSEHKTKSNTISSHGGRKRKKNPGFDIDYDPPKTHLPSHN